MSSFNRSAEENTTGAQDWTEVYEAVRWIQLVMAVLSVLGSGSIIVSVVLQRLGRTPELQPLLLLSVSDLLLAVCWLTGAVLFSQRCSVQNTHCYNLHTVEQVLYMSSFSYTLSYLWTLYRGLRDKLDSSLTGYTVQMSNRLSSAGKLMALLSLLVPLLLMAPVFITGNRSHCEVNFSRPYRCLLLNTGALFLTSEQRPLLPVCSLLHTYSIIIFIISFIITLSSITVLVGKSRRIHRRVVTSGGYLGNQQRAWFRVMDRRMVLYPLVFVLCWGPAVTLAFLRVVTPSAGHGVAGVVLYVSQAFTSASQGFLNSLVYGWTRVAVRRAGRTPWCRDVDTQTPLLRSQKKTRRRSYETLRTAG